MISKWLCRFRGHIAGPWKKRGRVFTNGYFDCSCVRCGAHLASRRELW